MATDPRAGAPRIAVVGVGHMGNLHAEKLAELEREGAIRFAGVCDANTERAREVARRVGTTVIEDVADVPRVADAACVAVPTTLHASVALALLEAGVDVLVEKPIATTRAEARALIDAATRCGRILQVGHIERFSQAFRAIGPVLRRPRFIEVHRIGPFPGRANDVSVVLDLMIHDLDIAASLAGSEVERVEAVGVPVLSASQDIANARVRFANGCILNLTASRVSLDRLRKVRVFQSDAYISIDFGANEITVVRREGRPEAGEMPRIRAEKIALDPADALLAQDRAFAESVRMRTPPLVTGDDGYRALDLALRIEESIEPMEDAP
jgi:predicted dehydrogenase